MGLLICVCQLNFENIGANLRIQHYPPLPPQTPDNKESFYFHRVLRDLSLAFAHSVPQTSLRGWLGKDFDPHFIHKEIASETQMTHLSSHGRQTTPPSLIPGKKERNNQHLKVFRKIF